MAGKFLHQGQICLAINRIFLNERLHDELVDLFLERVAALKVGHPADIDTDLGPIINETQLASILQKVEETVRLGEHWISVQEVPRGYPL